jgi:acetyl esterase/lipase
MLESDIPYGTGSGRELVLDVLHLAPPGMSLRPAVIWVHGGGWRGGEREFNPNSMLAERGFVTATISYRFSQEAIFPAQIHDVKAAIRFLRANASRWRIDPERIGIWGHSAGGHLAALAAVSEGIPALEGEGGNPDESSLVQAAVPMSAPADFLVDWSEESAFPPHEEVIEVIPQLLGGADFDDPLISEQARLASPVALATADSAPMLVVHGTLDDLVPVSQSRRLVTTLIELGVDASLLEFPEGDHSMESMIGPENGTITPARQEIIDFFMRTLGPVEGAGNAG